MDSLVVRTETRRYAYPVLLLQEAVIVLNQTGYEILPLCDGTHTVSEIIQDLENQLQRKELEALVRVARESGLYANLITSGLGLTETAVRRC